MQVTATYNPYMVAFFENLGNPADAPVTVAVVHNASHRYLCMTTLTRAEYDSRTRDWSAPNTYWTARRDAEGNVTDTHVTFIGDWSDL